MSVPVLNRPEVESGLGPASDAAVIAPIIVGVPRAPGAHTTREDPEILCWRKG